MATWATVTDARRHWADARQMDDEELTPLLAASQIQCEAYAPDQGTLTTVPANLMLAVIMQAREIWSAGKREGDVLGLEGYTVRARPLPSTVKALLRPRTGRPRFGSKGVAQ